MLGFKRGLGIRSGSGIVFCRFKVKEYLRFWHRTRRIQSDLAGLTLGVRVSARVGFRVRFRIKVRVRARVMVRIRVRVFGQGWGQG